MEEVLEEEPSILEQGSTMDRGQPGSNTRLDTSQFILRTSEQELSDYPMPSELQRHSLIQNDLLMSSYYSKGSFRFPPPQESQRESASLGPVPSKHLLTMKTLAYTNHPLYKPSFQQLSGRAIESERTEAQRKGRNSPVGQLLKPRNIIKPRLISQPIESLGVDRYYRNEERLLDRKISKDEDNPANLAIPPNERPRPILVQTSYDWSLNKFAMSYSPRYNKPKKPQNAKDAFLTRGVLDSSYNYPLFGGEPSTASHSLMKKRIQQIKNQTITRMSNMNIKPPIYWRPRGPSQQKDILNVTCLDVSNIIGHRYVKHDKNSNFSPNSTNTFLPVQKARELSPLSSPINRHGLIHVALDGKTEIASSKPRVKQSSILAKKRALSSRTELPKMGNTFTSGFGSSFYSNQSPQNAPATASFNLNLETQRLRGGNLESKRSLQPPMETPKFPVVS